VLSERIVFIHVIIDAILASIKRFWVFFYEHFSLFLKIAKVHSAFSTHTGSLFEEKFAVIPYKTYEYTYRMSKILFKMNE
jgi:hypothetical protein